MSVIQKQLYGLDDQHLVDCLGHQLEEHTAAAFLTMQQAALLDGIDLQICSGFRHFERQMRIWNAKASGERAVLNRQSKAITIDNLSSDELIETILIWSAIPGMSRHHWGTDIDVFDGNKINKQDLQLISQEYEQDGPCFELSQWLNCNAEKHGFYRPFQQGLSGVSPEAWHLSYFPVAEHLMNAYDVSHVCDILNASSVCLKSAIVAQIDTLVAEYVYRVAPVPKC
ncbi:peptidase M15 [Shewanella sairae]|uniref:Peptidase M15 n=1 Tax=Shewanella sairae TaxID=190310 RepID=A0ABQ4PJW7_9GAMM|nr:M15 family metallopeptidase [Shewanella sairae]MCL1130278.1 M15 family metallopeptidase [Shewanella sairae]GIU48111.1 peptidase M15 [Shewanella sairae]